MQAAKRIIVNADDFGYREDINRGIIYAHKNGIDYEIGRASCRERV